MNGFCECGCGKPAPIASVTKIRLGWVKGQPMRFRNGHAGGFARVQNGRRVRSMPEYRAYLGAQQRCTNPKRKHFDRYGGRGIRFLFSSFEEWFADLGPRPSPQHSVDRKDNDGHYNPGNVRWATKTEQAANRHIKGEPCVQRAA
jgi:hypothetical protein